MLFFAGYMTMEQMVAYLNAADIYISSSKADAGLAASTAEAMSVGLPVLVSNNSENSFWVENAGLLFEDGDAKGISECILKLIDKPELAMRFGENGRSKILKDNNYKIEMKKLMNSISTYNQYSNNLLLLTVNYPYGNSEQFLAGELTYLAKSKKNVLIYSRENKGKRDLCQVEYIL